jgi:hypothetical protein
LLTAAVGGLLTVVKLNVRGGLLMPSPGSETSIAPLDIETVYVIPWSKSTLCVIVRYLVVVPHENVRPQRVAGSGGAGVIVIVLVDKDDAVMLSEK